MKPGVAVRRFAALPLLAGLLAVTATAAVPMSMSGGSDGREAGAGSDSLLEAVPDRGVLRVCTTGDYRPFTHRDRESGKFSGIDIDMAEDLAESLDAKPRYVPTTWDEITDDLVSGDCDIAVGGVSVTLERARDTYFSEPTRTDGKTPVVRCADKDKYRTLKQIDTPGTTVIVNPGGTNEEFARENIERAELKQHPENTTIFEEIVAGRADVMMTDASETQYQAKINPELCSVHPDDPFTFAEKAYALPRGDEEFKEYVDQFVHLATNDGTYQRYSDKWLK